MNIDKLFEDNLYLEKQLTFFFKKNHIQKIDKNDELVSSFLKKSKHNLAFYKQNKTNLDFDDWLIVILYYALYHAALALITHKNFSSKNHYATILILIKEYGLTKNEIYLINELSINKKDAELYTNLKRDRHRASYLTKTLFDEQLIRKYELQVIEFIQKTEDLINIDF